MAVSPRVEMRLSGLGHRSAIRGGGGEGTGRVGRGEGIRLIIVNACLEPIDTVFFELRGIHDTVSSCVGNDWVRSMH